MGRVSKKVQYKGIIRVGEFNRLVTGTEKYVGSLFGSARRRRHAHRHVLAPETDILTHACTHPEGLGLGVWHNLASSPPACDHYACTASGVRFFDLTEHPVCADNRRRIQSGCFSLSAVQIFLFCFIQISSVKAGLGWWVRGRRAATRPSVYAWRLRWDEERLATPLLSK